MTAKQIIDTYISFFEKQGHKRIPSAPLVPFNDPTTLFTSSGMQPLVPYLLGEPHPEGVRLVDVQNSFRAVDIDEVGDNRHTTFFRMLGNWSLGDYFKEEQIRWVWELLTNEFGLNPKKLFVTVFAGNGEIEKDETSYEIWKQIFKDAGLDPKERISLYGVDKNWWSRSGPPEDMPAGEPGGPDSEIFYDFGEELKIHEQSKWNDQLCHVNCDCGRFLEICNSVFMQYIKTFATSSPQQLLTKWPKVIEEGKFKFELLPKKNVDFGGGLERLLMAIEDQPDVFQTNLYQPIVNQVIKSYFHGIYEEGKNYKPIDYPRNDRIYSSEEEQQAAKETSISAVRIVTDHFISAVFLASAGVIPSNKEQGYILRRLIRRGLEYFYLLGGKDIESILHKIVEQYSITDSYLQEKFEEIKYTILQEQQKYEISRTGAISFLSKTYDTPQPFAYKGDEVIGKIVEISPQAAFNSLASYGTAPTQLKSLGYTFDDQKLAELIKQHSELSRTASAGKFKGGLADAQDLTIKGHTATHLLQQALRDILGNHVFQTGSNITTERLRFDFSHPDRLTPEQIEKVQEIVREKIKEDLSVHFEMLPLKEAKDTGAIGLFDEKYEQMVKIYFIGGSNPHSNSITTRALPSEKGRPKGERDQGRAYSIEFCGGPHVEHTNIIKSFEITKQESIGKGQQRIYAVVS